MSNLEGLLEQHGKPEREVYLDWENGSVVDKEVLDAMIPIYLEKTFGNPAITHKMGWETLDFYMKSKNRIANPLSVAPQSIALTHSSTESNNLAIKGLAKMNKKRKKIIVSEVEHLSIIHSAKSMFNQDYKVEVIPVSNDGTINIDILQDKVDDETLLVSL